MGKTGFGENLPNSEPPAEKGRKEVVTLRRYTVYVGGRAERRKREETERNRPSLERSGGRLLEWRRRRRGGGPSQENEKEGRLENVNKREGRGDIGPIRIYEIFATPKTKCCVIVLLIFRVSYLKAEIPSDDLRSMNLR